MTIALALALVAATAAAAMYAVKHARSSAEADRLELALGRAVAAAASAEASTDELRRRHAVVDLDRMATIDQLRETLRAASESDPNLAHLRLLGVLRSVEGDAAADVEPVPVSPSPKLAGLPKPRRPG
jgi:hypothetical protein